MNQEGMEQAKSDLLEMFRCPGWQTARELMRHRLREIETHIATDFRLEIDQVRDAQREHRLIRSLIENPMQWMMSGIKVTGENEP